jgi:hypothetical protein
MNNKKPYLLLAIVAGISCAMAGDNAEPPRFAEDALLAPAHPGLLAIERLSVRIIPVGTDAKQANLDWDSLRVEAQRALEKDAIPVIMANEAPAKELPITPALNIRIQVLRLADLQQCVLCIQTSLSRAVYLKPEASLIFRADVWQTEPLTELVPAKSLPARVSDGAMQQVRGFIRAYKVTTAYWNRSAAGNHVLPTTSAPPPRLASGNAVANQAAPQTESAAAEYQFVASKNSPVFHKPDCRWARNISPTNLTSYSSRDAAMQAGKRPCKWCNP